MKIHRISISSRAKSLIRSLKLKPHPEGGYYREIYRSSEKITVSRGKRDALTQIYFLLVKGEISRWHCVLSDESWNYVEGSPLKLYRLDPMFKKLNQFKLGSLKQSAHPTVMIPKNHWQAAESTGDYTLVTCLVAPGFEFHDFSLLSENQILKNNIFQKIKLVRQFV